MSRSASSKRWLARQETRAIKADRAAMAEDRRANPRPAGTWFVSALGKSKTQDRKDGDRRRKNANWYPNPVKPKWLRSGPTFSYCRFEPMKK